MICLAGVAAGSAAVLAGYAAAFLPPGLATAAPWLLWAGMAVLLPSLLGLGLRSGGARGGAWLAMGVVFLVVCGGLGGALLLPPESAETPLVLGLPRRAALLLYGVGLLPGLVLSVIYAASFDRLVLNRERLLELERRLRELQSGPVS